MNWVKEGMRAAREAPGSWRDIGEHLYRQACAERDGKISQLQVEGPLLQQEERQVVDELNATAGRPPHVLRLSLTLGSVYTVAACVMFLMNYDILAQTLVVAAYQEGRRFAYAGAMTVAVALAIEGFLRGLRRIFPEPTYRLWLLGLTLVPVLALFGAVMLLSLIGGQYEGVARVVTLQQATPVTVEGAVPAGEPPGGQAAVETFYRRMGRLSSLFRIFMAAGLELAAALALHEALARTPAALFMLGVHRRLRRVRRRIAGCMAAIRQAQAAPEILRAEFLRGGLLVEGRAHPEPLPIELRAGPVHLSREAAISLAILAAIAIFVLIFFVLVRDALADDMVVVGVDLTASSGGGAFTENRHAVERIIVGLTLGSRLVVLGINDRSFTHPSILDARLTTEPGLFGERLRTGQSQLMAVWRERSGGLKANAKTTDVFGMIRQAALLYEERPGGTARLVLLSDMRQFGRGYNFETESGVTPTLLQRVEREGLIPALKGVKVWILGAHALGISERHWLALAAFWKEYFQRAGAQLVSFSADRRWTP